MSEAQEARRLEQEAEDRRKDEEVFNKNKALVMKVVDAITTAEHQSEAVTRNALDVKAVFDKYHKDWRNEASLLEFKENTANLKLFASIMDPTTPVEYMEVQATKYIDSIIKGRDVDLTARVSDVCDVWDWNVATTDMSARIRPLNEFLAEFNENDTQHIYVDTVNAEILRVSF